jgi:hypothetical protein
MIGGINRGAAAGSFNVDQATTAVQKMTRGNSLLEMIGRLIRGEIGYKDLFAWVTSDRDASIKVFKGADQETIKDFIVSMAKNKDDLSEKAIFDMLQIADKEETSVAMVAACTKEGAEALETLMGKLSVDDREKLLKTNNASHYSLFQYVAIKQESSNCASALDVIIRMYNSADIAMSIDDVIKFVSQLESTEAPLSAFRIGPLEQKKQNENERIAVTRMFTEIFNDKGKTMPEKIKAFKVWLKDEDNLHLFINAFAGNEIQRLCANSLMAAILKHDPKELKEIILSIAPRADENLGIAAFAIENCHPDKACDALAAYYEKCELGNELTEINRLKPEMHGGPTLMGIKKKDVTACALSFAGNDVKCRVDTHVIGQFANARQASQFTNLQSCKIYSNTQFVTEDDLTHLFAGAKKLKTFTVERCVGEVHITREMVENALERSCRTDINVIIYPEDPPPSTESLA